MTTTELLQKNPAPSTEEIRQALTNNICRCTGYANIVKAVIAAAEAEAKKRDWKMGIAVLDSGGNLVAFERMDGTQLAAIAVSEHKARAAVLYRRETKVFENAIQENHALYVMTLDGVVGSRGGIPLVADGKVVGAIGCSGGTGSQDEVACKAGAETVK